MGFSARCVALVPVTEKFIPNLEDYLSKLVMSKGGEKAPWFLGVPRLGFRTALERLTAPGVFKFVTIFLPTSWIFTIMAETRRGYVLFRGLHLLTLNSKDFSGLPFN